MTTLSDGDIAKEIAIGQLIKNGDLKRLSGACYELRLGSVYYDLTEGDSPIPLQPGEKALIKPGHRVVLITHEELLVPDDVLVRIVSKGSLFSIGLSPVATYADPGFAGNLGIVTQNVSDKYIVLPQLEPIAKADFTKLSGPTQKRYSGQHGFQTEIWPIKHHLQKTHAELANDPRVKSEKDEGYKLLPVATRRVLKHLEFRQHLVDIGLLVAVLLNAFTLFSVTRSIVASSLGLIGNLVASLIAGAVLYYAKLAKRRD